MKCDNCGYIFNGDFDKCPYCGKVQSVEDKNILHANVPLGQHNNIRVRTILNIVLINMFLTLFFLDWLVFKFQYRVTLFAFVVCFGALLVVSILYAAKDPLSVYLRVDFFLILSIMIAAASAQFPFGDYRSLIGFLVLPAYLLISSIIFIFMLLRGRGKKFRPFVTEFSMLFHLAIVIADLVLFLIAFLSQKHLLFALLPGLEGLQQFSIYGAFGVAILLFLNFNIVLILSIFNKVKYIYGK